MIEIDLKFDMVSAYDYDDNNVSPIGLQMQVFAPYTYSQPSPMVYYKLLPDDEVNLQPSMQIKAGKLTFLCERFNTGVVAKAGGRLRMEDAYCVQ